MITLQTKHLQIINCHAEKVYPEECCGLLLGRLKGESKLVTEVWETENIWDSNTAASFQEITGLKKRESSKERSFTIDPKVMLQAQKYAYKQQLSIIGIYHSHPDYPAIPSEFDRAIAWQQYSYIIVSVNQGKAQDIRSWVLDEEHQFQEEVFLVDF